MSIVGDNIRALRVMRGQNGEDMTQSELAEKIGVSRETVNKWETGTIPNLRDSNIKKLRELFSLTVDDLRSESLGLAAQLRGGSNMARTFPVIAREDATVPLVTLGRVHAGPFTDEEEAERQVEVPASLLRSHPNARALIVEGDCMNRVVPDGMSVVYDPDMEPRNGSIAIVEAEGYCALMRRWYRGSGTLMLGADSHEDYEDIVLTEKDGPVKVIGTVVWVQSTEEMS